MTHEIYLDANATSPVLPAAIAAAGGRHAARASAIRAAATRPACARKALLDGVRDRARRVLGAGAGRVIFTSGATEGIQTAVLSALCAVRERQAAGEAVGDLLLYGATEHKAVPEALAHWNRLLGTGLTLRALPVDGDGRHRLDVLRQLAPRAAMVCTMAANNETGVISDLDAIDAVLRVTAQQARYWMVDSVQALGKLPLALAEHPHRLRAVLRPQAVRAERHRHAVRARRRALHRADGGRRPGSGQRSGTENMAGIAALGAVLAALEDGRHLPHARRSCTPAASGWPPACAKRFPASCSTRRSSMRCRPRSTSRCPACRASDLLDLFDAAGVRVSAGSACSAAKAAPSYVLEAMELPDWRCASAVRMSFGPLADDAFIDAACERIARCGRAMRKGGLVPPALRHDVRDDVIRLGLNGATTWLALDEATRSCVVIDPVEPLGERIASMIRSRDYRVRGIIGTSNGSGEPAARAALATLLDGQIDFTGTADPFGWPAGSDSISLGDGTRTDGISLGEQVLARVPHDGDGTQSYLMGANSNGTLHAADVRFAFTGATPSDLLHEAVQRMTTLLNGDTVLCPSQDSTHIVCTTPSARARVMPSHDAMEAAARRP